MQRSKAPNEQTIPLLMPQHHMVLPHYMGRSREIEVESKTSELNSKDLNGQDPFPSGSPPEDIPLLLPQEADCDEEVSCTDEKLTGLVSSLLLKFDVFLVNTLSLGLKMFLQMIFIT